MARCPCLHTSCTSWDAKPRSNSHHPDDSLWFWSDRGIRINLHLSLASWKEDGTKHIISGWWFQIFFLYLRNKPIWSLPSSHESVIGYHIWTIPEWWFQIYCLCSWENDPIWRAYLSYGLVQPPTRHFQFEDPLWHELSNFAAPDTFKWRLHPITPGD